MDVEESAGVDNALLERRVREFAAADANLGYRSLHTKLKDEAGLEQVSLKKVQKLLTQVRQEQSLEAAAAPAAPAKGKASPGENIWTACSDGDIARAEELMDLEGFTPVSADENGYTPIHAAASWGRVELLKLLFARLGANTATGANIQDTDGDTPLHHLANADELEPDVLREVMDVLLAAGADPKLQNHEAKTCLETCGDDVMEDEEEETMAGSINMEFVKAMAERGHKLE